MEKSKPMELGLGELLSNENIVNNNSFRLSTAISELSSALPRWIASSLAQGSPTVPEKAGSSGY